MRTKMFTSFGSAFWKNTTAIEVFKFSLYIIIPVGCSFIYSNPKATTHFDDLGKEEK
ncbi:hypothetical protein B484DRAFT_401041 [Ochromonadaceae sp. CCMP2298]|nr:hypothetical protein B484DRAFT_401041 [Ochromonadaceae sp. CCMP2298]